MTLQRILGAAALTLIITAAYAATSDPADSARAQAVSPTTSANAEPAAATDGG